MIKITAICENTVSHKKCWAEEGLSLLIEINEPSPIKILYDCGRSGDVLIHNFDILGFEFNTIDYLVLSHGHSGHIGGLQNIIERKQNICIVVHPDIFVQKMKKKSDTLSVAGNQPYLKSFLMDRNTIISKEPLKISDTIAISGEIPIRETTLHKTNRYFVKTNDVVEPDLFIEELAIGVRVKNKLLLITSCSHRGVINIANHISSLFDDLPLYGVIGGFHLCDNIPETEKLIVELKTMKIKLIAPCHCTGLLSIAEIRKAFNFEFFSFHTGDVIVL